MAHETLKQCLFWKFHLQNMKKTHFILGLLLMASLGAAQTLSPKVTPAAGGYATHASGINLSFTIGETQVTTLSASGQMLSQGEQQPEVDLKMTQISGTLCPGNTVNASFWATGYVVPGNMFSLQLSDANGSFAAPLTLGTANGIYSGNINGSVPSNIAIGSGYRARVVSSQPYLVGVDAPLAGCNCFPPALTCPASLTVNTAINQCGNTAGWVAPTATGNCGPSLSGSATPNSTFFQKGTTTVTYTATNAQDNQITTCSFTVTVVDNQAPQLVNCPANMTKSADVGRCDAVVAFSSPTASDNCPSVSVVQTDGPASGSTFSVGVPVTVRFKATDAAGLTATCSFSVTVIDNQSPTMTCPANQTKTTDVGLCTATVTYNTPSASDNCTLPSGQPQWVSGGTAHNQGTTTSTAVFPKGITTIQWKVTDGVGLTKTCTFRVIVSDAQPPSLTCPASINVNTGANTCTATVTYTAPTYTDNCSPTSGTAVRISGPASGSAFSVGTTNVIFQATDASNNTQRCTMTVTVTDNHPPSITCPQSVTVSGSGAPCTQTVFYTQPTASDNCAGTLTPFLVSGWASGSIFAMGTTTNTWRAVAPNGQSSECSFNVTVECPGNRVLNTDPIATSAAPAIPQVALDFRLFPNPATTQVRFMVYGLGKAAGEVLVSDALGREVLRQPVVTGQTAGILDVSGWPAGQYQVALRSKMGYGVKALVVVR